MAKWNNSLYKNKDVAEEVQEREIPDLTRGRPENRSLVNLIYVLEECNCV